MPSIDGAVLQRFSHMIGAYPVRAREIGDRTRNSEHTLEPARTETESIDRPAQQRPALGAWPT